MHLGIMHPCLDIPEIVGVVCSQLDSRAVSDRRALAALARTSSAFHSPALNRLWHSQHSIENLLRCMPPVLFAFHRDTWSRIVMVRLRRPILASDWDRSRQYARRVRRLSCDSANLVLSQIFPALSTTLPDGFEFLCPNLNNLFWHHPEADFHHINLFLTPALTHLSFSEPFLPSHLSILPTLPRQCPSLQRFSTSGQKVPLNACMFLTQLQHLESLYISVDDMATLQLLGRLETLTNLELSGILIEPSPSPVHDPLFLNVRSVDLYDVSAESATRFVEMCPDTSFTSVMLDLNSHPTTSAVKQLYASLAGCRRSHTTLVYIMIHQLAMLTPTIREDITSYVIDAPALRVLFCFENIENIYIESAAFHLDDAVVLDIARSWPRLSNLGLIVPLRIMEPRVSLLGLAFLARYCPHLRSLHMTFDASDIPAPDPDNGGAPASQTSLTSINAACSPIRDPLAVAQFISGIFPRVKSISATPGGDDEEDEEELDRQTRWNQVESHLIHREGGM